MSHSPAVAREQWLDAVTKALKQESAADALASLRSTTYDGITVEPLYTAADAVDPAVGLGLPGTGPLLRGRTPGSTRPTGWDIRQIVDAAAGGRQALDELEHGATSVWLDLHRVELIDADLLGAALDGVLLDLAPVVLDAGRRWPVAAESLAGRWSSAGLTPTPGGSLGADPYGDWVADRAGVDLDAELAAAAGWASRLATDAPGVRTVTIDGRRYHDAGASDGLELAFAIAATVATLRALDTVADPFAAIELRLAATGDQFATIAKFRAARQLLARIADVAGEPEGATRIPLHAVMSTAMMTRYDPAVNMLRGTVACFSAGVAGADAITVVPFDSLSAVAPTELGRRLARNTQSVLALESHLSRVIDPAGGSWYVEHLTAELADVAWAELQRIEAAGGFRAAVEAGMVATRLATVSARRAVDIDHRRLPITGLSEFPNIAESTPAAQPPPAPSSAGSLERHRWAERFEELRSRVDDQAGATGVRPTVFVATLGTPADFTARATFAKNFFEVAGIVTATGTLDEFDAASAVVVCVCSSNAVYKEQADDAVASLTAAGARRVYVAGRDTIVAGGDARAALADLLDFLEIP